MSYFWIAILLCCPIVSPITTIDRPSCSVIQLRREILSHRPHPHETTDPYTLLLLSDLEFRLAYCLQSPLSGLHHGGSKRHLERASLLSLRSIEGAASASSISNHRVLRSSTAIHARSLAALNHPIEARSYFRLLSRFMNDNIGGDDDDYDDDSADDDNSVDDDDDDDEDDDDDDDDDDETSLQGLDAVDADLAQVELHICSSSRFPHEFCNVSAVGHHVREDMLRKERRIKERRRKMTLTTAATSRITNWASIFRRNTNSRGRTHLVPLRQKIRHDVRQLRYLQRQLRLQGRQKEHYQTIEHAYQKLGSVLQRNQDRELSWEDVDLTVDKSLTALEKHHVAVYYGSVLNFPRTKWNVRTSVLSSTFLHNTNRAERLYSKQGWVVVDDVLTIQAIESIQKHLLESTIWNDPRLGYLGAYGNSGVLFDTTVMLAKEIGRLMPSIIQGRPLVQMWCYKYDSNYNHQNKSLEDSGIAVHADDAKINMNIWLTKTTDPTREQSGGLIIYPDLKSNKKDSFHEFNQSPSRVNVKNARQVKILHKTNRMVMFDSSMYHQSDAGMNFGHKYEESRINLTLLYGRRKEK